MSPNFLERNRFEKTFSQLNLKLFQKNKLIILLNNNIAEFIQNLLSILFHCNQFYSEKVFHYVVQWLFIWCCKKCKCIFWRKVCRRFNDYSFKSDERRRVFNDAVKYLLMLDKYYPLLIYFFWSSIFSTFRNKETQVLTKNTEAVSTVILDYILHQFPITVTFDIFKCDHADFFEVFLKNTITLLEKKKSFTEIAEHNANLVKHCRLFNSLLSPILFLYLVGCSLLICISAIQLTGSTNATQMLFLAEYLVFGIAQLFLFCWHSNGVLYKFEEVSSGPYESKWYSAGVKHAQNIHLLTGQLRFVYIFSAGPFARLTLPAFISILKAAYSYYTLLRK